MVSKVKIKSLLTSLYITKYKRNHMITGWLKLQRHSTAVYLLSCRHCRESKITTGNYPSHTDHRIGRHICVTLQVGSTPGKTVEVGESSQQWTCDLCGFPVLSYPPAYRHRNSTILCWNTVTVPVSGRNMHGCDPSVEYCQCLSSMVQ